jgi:hypothetical protein
LFLNDQLNGVYPDVYREPRNEQIIAILRDKINA